jgi:HEAT repeat protein
VSRDKPGEDLGYWLQCLCVADPNQRLHAAMVLGLMGDAAQPAVPALVEALRDRSAQVRRMVTAALNEIGPAARTAVPALVTALRDRCDTVRCRAAMELAGLGPGARAAVPALSAALKDVDAVVCRWAAFALGEVGPKAASAAPALLDLLRGDCPITRAIAAVALRKLGAAALPALLLGLKDNAARVRRQAAIILGKIAEPQDVLFPALREAFNDSDASVRAAALAALAAVADAALLHDTPAPVSGRVPLSDRKTERVV